MEFINELKIAKAATFLYKKYKAIGTEDGACWSADVYLNGVKIGAVFDGGTGGPLQIDIPEADMDRLVEAFKKAGYVLDLRVPGTEYILDEPKNSHEWLELVLPEMANHYDTLKYWKSQCKRKIIVQVKKGPEKENLLTYSQAYTPELAVQVRKQQGDELLMILNEEIVGL